MTAPGETADHRLEVTEVRIVTREKNDSHRIDRASPSHPQYRRRERITPLVLAEVRVACPHLVQTRALPENVLEHLYLTYVSRENSSAANVTRVGVVCQSADNP
jgi:hypothetical protein